MKNITIFKSISSSISICRNIELRKNSTFVVHRAVLFLRVAREDFCSLCLQDCLCGTMIGSGTLRIPSFSRSSFLNFISQYKINSQKAINKTHRIASREKDSRIICFTASKLMIAAAEELSSKPRTLTTNCSSAPFVPLRWRYA